MKKIKEVVNRNYKIVLVSIIGIILSSGGVYASAVIAETSIAYDNKKS